MDIFKFWQEIKYGAHIHPRDKEVFERIAERKHGFRTDCLPGCYAGDLKKAPVVLLFLSPGFDEKTDISEAKSKEGKDRHFNFWKGTQPIPEEWTGKKWFQSRTQHFGPYDLVREKVALLNIGAYHSTDVNDYASLMALPSSRASLDWAQTVLFPQAEKGERVVICMRSAAYWGLEVGRKYRGTLHAPEVTRGGYFKKTPENQKMINSTRKAIGVKEPLEGWLAKPEGGTK